MRFWLLLIMLWALVMCGDDCPHDQQVLCIDDINKGFAICDKAAKEGGKDVPADIQCIKYIAQVDQDCWSCICYIAQQQHWKIKGCD